MSVSPARAAAFDILLRVELEVSYAADLPHSSRCADLSAADHGLATELVMGVLRWRSFLDHAISQASSQRLQKLDPEVLTSLRLGAYQLGWLDRIPPHAALHESVELVKRARKRSAVPFANAVLRKIAVSSLIRSARVDHILSANSAAELARNSAHPEWMVGRWTSQFGLDTARATCAYDQSIPSSAIRLRSDSAEAELQREKIELAPGMFLANARLVVSGDVTRTQPLAQGGIAIQDEASQLIAALVGKGSRILDCCAAPGGKTWAIADRNQSSTIVAVELHPHRAEILRQRVAAPNLEIITGDIRGLPTGTAYDRVLVDVPCSGTGTLARNPEIKWRLKPEDLADLRSRQLSILQAAMKQVAPQGALIYSTCSLEHEENESVVDEALDANQCFRLVEMRPQLERLLAEGVLIVSDPDSLLRGPYLRTIPGIHPCDGFFAALLQKKN